MFTQWEKAVLIANFTVSYIEEPMLIIERAQKRNRREAETYDNHPAKRQACEQQDKRDAQRKNPE